MKGFEGYPERLRKSQDSERDQNRGGCRLEHCVALVNSPHRIIQRSCRQERQQMGYIHSVTVYPLCW